MKINLKVELIFIRMVLTQRQKANRKWPIKLFEYHWLNKSKATFLLQPFPCIFHRYTTPRKEVAPTPPQRKIIEERMVTREKTPPVQATPPSVPQEPKQRVTQEELTIEEVRKQGGTPAGAYSRPPPKNEYRYEEEMLPPPDEYHFEEKRTEMVAVPPDAMDSRKGEYAVML